MNESVKRVAAAWPNALVIAYIVFGWPAGVWLLTTHGAWLNGAGVLLTAHTLICSGYMIHDCAHNAIFKTPRGNDRLGMLMGWINGACLANYARMKKKHLRHHSDRMDVVTFDYRSALNRLPVRTRRLVLAMEWAYVPTVELFMRGMIVAMPFKTGTPAERVRVVLLLSLRIAFFAVLAFVSVKAIFLYAFAYLIFVQVLRFLDSFQHTYEVFASSSLQPAPKDPRRDLRYEYENTYSNLVAERWWWLNLLVLNFPYHNAHHVRPSLPWYRLRKLHYSLYRQEDQQVITCRQLLASYHRHRVTRIFATDCGSVAASGDRAGGFLGAVGVSFLTAV